MFRISVLVAAIITIIYADPFGLSLPASGEQPYQPSVPAPSMTNYNSGGWSGYGGGGGGTAAGSAMNGMSNVISAKGNYNLATSAAAVNMTQAEKQDIQNRQAATNAYFEMRATNRAARAAEAGPPLTMEQTARIARISAPKPVSPKQVDPVSGKINWPELLQDDRYAAQRSELDQLMAKRAAYGGLGYSDQTKFRETIDGMFEDMKGRVREVPTGLYSESRVFLASLSYAVTKTQIT